MEAPVLQNLRNLILVLLALAVPDVARAQGVMPVREQGQALTSLQLLDDIIHTANATLNKAALIACQFDNVSPGTVTENNVSPVRCSTLRELFGVIRDAAGNDRGANVNASNELLVALSSVPTHAVTQSGTWGVSITQGGNTAAVNASSQLSVNCANCSGSGVSQQDNTGFTAGTTNMVPMAGFVGSTAVTAGNAGAMQMTTDRMLFTNLGKVGGTAFALGQTTMSASLPVTLASNQSTLPVSLASVPSHAVTNAGTFVVQENGAALTALQLLDNLVATIGSTTSGQSGALGMGAVTTAAPTYTTAQTHPLSLTTSGELRVRMESTAVGSTSTDDDGALPSGTTNMSEVLSRMYAFNSDSASGVYTRFSHQPLDYDSGAGTENLSVIGIGLPASGGPVVGGTSANPFNVVFPSSQSVSLSAALPAGTNNIGDVDVLTVPTDPFGTNADAASATGSISAKLRFIAATGIPVTSLPANASINIAQMNGATVLMGAGNTGTGSLRTTEATDSQLSAGVGATGDAAATAGSTGSITAKLRLMTSQLDAIQTAVQLIDDDQTGASMHHRVSAGTTEDEHEVKGSAGRLFAINVTNTNAAARYLRCANQVAASTTPGTTTVWYGMAIPGNTTGAGYTANFGPSGVAFSTGLTCWLVTGAAETDVAEVAANEINVNYSYK